MRWVCVWEMILCGSTLSCLYFFHKELHLVKRNFTWICALIFLLQRRYLKIKGIFSSKMVVIINCLNPVLKVCFCDSRNVWNTH